MPDLYQLSDVIAALPLPALVIEADERIIALNAEAEAVVGAGALGRNFVTVLRQPTLVEAVELCLADGKPRTAEYLASVNGAEQTFDVKLSQLTGAQSVILCFKDISQMAQASQMRRDFVANVSHELRTPLTSLTGFIETLRTSAKDDPVARTRFLGIMDSEASRMNRLIGDLLSLSRVESEARVRPTTRANIGDVLQSTLRSLTQLASEGGVMLKPDIKAADVQIRGDADQLTQVFTNLIENAIKYGGGGELVEITAETQQRDPAMRGPSVRVHVTDHGPGIAPVHLPRLTERFYRADNHRSRMLGGTGLGLAITKHILNRHRGRLKVRSVLGQGATFTVILPLDQVAE